jgi:hypothetical protein
MYSDTFLLNPEFIEKLEYVMKNYLIEDVFKVLKHKMVGNFYFTSQIKRILSSILIEHSLSYVFLYVMIRDKCFIIPK